MIFHTTDIVQIKFTLIQLNIINKFNRSTNFVMAIFLMQLDLMYCPY